MIKVFEHIPAFIEVDRPRYEHEVQSLEELLVIDYIKDWLRASGFIRFSLKPLGFEDYTYLMAEMCDSTYWVVAQLKGEIEGFPEFDAEVCKMRGKQWNLNGRLRILGLKK